MNDLLTANETITASYEIPCFNLESAVKKLERLVKRSAKLGVGGFSYSVGEKFIAERDTGRHNSKGESVVVRLECCEVTVTGDAPNLAGWTFAATVEHEEAGNIIRKVPGVEIEAPLSYRTASRKCEHCNKVRSRKDTYLIVNEDGQWKKVGKTCLESFLGVNVDAFLSILSCWSNLSDLAGDFDYDDYCARGEPVYNLVDLLVHVALVVRLDGWYSRTAARDSDGRVVASVDTACWVMSPSFTHKEQKEKDEYLDKLLDDDADFAKAALAWVREDWGNKPVEKRTEYENNMLVAIADEFCVSRRKVGLVGSLIAAYRRHIGQVEERKAAMKDRVNEHFGSLEPERIEITRGKNKGQFREKARRYDLLLTIEKIIDVEGDYGTTFIHKMRDEAGRSFTWRGSNHLYTVDRSKTAKEGDKVQATWGIKKHYEYQGVKQTVLTRPTVIAVFVEA